jgi:hypothetical protein
MATAENESLIEAAASAFRPPDRQGAVRHHPAWWDLDEAGRREAYQVTLTSRALEAALDPDGLSSTAKAVLARVRRR